jgi:hypothetical protein
MNSKSNYIMGLMLLVSIPTMSQATKDTTFSNALKLNSAALAFKNISLQYERRLSKHWSVLMGSGYKWGGKIPKVVGLGEVVITSSTSGLRGYSFTPEARYYFNFCGCGASHTGFYAGLYTRFTKLYGDLTFNFWDGTDYIDVAGAGDMRELGVGLQLGYQFVFKKRFVVDLMFAGPRTSWNRIHLSVASDYAEDLIPIIEDEINKRLEWMGRDPISLPTSPEAEVKFGFTNFRYALGIGYIF